VVGDLFTLATPAWNLVLRTTVIYLALLAGFRIFGKREIGQFTPFDLVLVLLVANALQPAMTGPDVSLLGGLIILVVLLVLNWGVGQLRDNPRLAPFLAPLLQSKPSVIVQDGQWLTDEMRRQGIDEDDAAMAFREHGIERVDQVKLAVLEIDGTISVVPMDACVYRGRRRVRFVKRAG
jgi:uncharacterized membrane protein YcaP (DUF421 family)